MLKSYVGMTVSGYGSVYYSVPNVEQNNSRVKITESIAQKSTDIMNGPGGGFSETGSQTFNGSWSGVKVNTSSMSYFLGAVSTVDDSYPGIPFVKYSPKPYPSDTGVNSVTGIDISTVPLPGQ